MGQFTFMFLRPCKKSSSIKNTIPLTKAPCFSTKRAAAEMVPPVARTSSSNKTFSPLLKASLCISMVAMPYSKEYSSESVCHGSLPFLRIGVNPQPSSRAMQGPKKNPLDSIAATF